MGVDFAWALFRETGVAVLDAQAFGASCTGFVRVWFTVADQDLLDACRRIRQFTETLRTRR